MSAFLATSTSFQNSVPFQASLISLGALANQGNFQAISSEPKWSSSRSPGWPRTRLLHSTTWPKMQQTSASRTTPSRNLLRCSRGLQIAASTLGEIIGCLSVRVGLCPRIFFATQSAKGPKTNPAKLPTDGKLSIYSLFAQIFRTAIDTASSKEPVRFLSRYDKSAANIAESRIWTTIGQTPWAHPYSPWYHRFVDFPFQALRAASRLGEYTLLDRGTWFAIESEVRDAMAVFVSWLNAFSGNQGKLLMEAIAN